ncbi:MAG: hypothetical protein ACLP1D_26870 [Xanthobacteraceae bacterium]
MDPFPGIFLALAAALLVEPVAALAHDPDTGKPNWITDGAYRNRATGARCCGPKDCDRLDAKQVQATPRGFILHAYNDELVPYSEATPSEDGKYWRCHGTVFNHVDGSKSGGERLCFFAPVGTE